MQRPYVAICVASAGIWKPQMGQALAHLTYVSTMHCDLGVLIAEGTTAPCRNRLVLSALQAKTSHVLFVDADNTFPADGLAQLLSHNKDIVGACYMRRAEPYTMLGVWGEQIKGTPLAPAKQLPGGFLLIKTSVFGRIEPPWFHEPVFWDTRTAENVTGTQSDDCYFCEKAIAAGFKLFVDLNVTQFMGHIGEINVKCAPKQAEQQIHSRPSVILPTDGKRVLQS